MRLLPLLLLAACPPPPPAAPASAPATLPTPAERAREGHARLEGDGLPFDAVAGCALLDGACSDGHLPACGELGLALRLGKCGERREPDFARARVLLGRACDGAAGVDESCVHLADLDLAGLGAPADGPRARGLLARACDGGVLEGCYLLGLVFTEGLGGVPYAPESFVVGARRFARACDAGHARACAKLAELTAAGKGVPLDGTRARALLERACALGDTTACPPASHSP